MTTTWKARLLQIAGSGCVALGAVGLVVPGLPTTVFLLAASWLFARSSPRLHARLLAHPRLGPFLEMARERRMPLRAKVVSLGLMWTGIGAGCLATGAAAAWLPALLVGSGVVGTAALCWGLRTGAVGAAPA
jgi:hypothetical protein